MAQFLFLFFLVRPEKTIFRKLGFCILKILTGSLVVSLAGWRKLTLGLTILQGLLPPTTQQEKITSSAHSFPSACRAALRCQLPLCEIRLHGDKALLQNAHMMESLRGTNLTEAPLFFCISSLRSQPLAPILDGLPLADPTKRGGL